MLPELQKPPVASAAAPGTLPADSPDAGSFRRIDRVSPADSEGRWPVTDAPATIPKPRPRRRLLPGLFRRSRAAWFCSVGTSTWDRWAAAGLTPAPAKISGV